MDENGTYSWPGGTTPPPEEPKEAKKPKKSFTFKKLSRIIWTVVLILALVIAGLTCFYTVNDKQQAVVTTF